MPDRRPRVVVVTPHEDELELLRGELPAERFELYTFTDRNEAMEFVRRTAVAVLVASDDGKAQTAVDWLLEVRSTDPEVCLVLAADRDVSLELAAEALNRAKVVKILAKPWDPYALVEDVQEAVELYSTGFQKARNAALSHAKVRRLTTDREALERELEQKRREIKALRGMVEHSSGAGYVADGALPFDGTPPAAAAIVASMLAIARCSSAKLVAHCERVAKLVAGCARALRFSPAECRTLHHAALLHHLALPAHPQEYLVEVRGTKAMHADAMATVLERMSGFDQVARIVRTHHDRGRDVGRDARLLQILSLYDELAHDPQVVAAAADDPTHALTTAADEVLARAGDSLDRELCHTTMLELVPDLLERDERGVLPEDARAGMILSRCLRAGDITLAEGTTLRDPELEMLAALADDGVLRSVWISGRSDPHVALRSTALG